MRVRMILEYDGTAYVGWQTQLNGIAVQQLLEEALATVTGERVLLHASGRTDSGVHALAQVAHFDTQARMPADKYALALNALLPQDIRVRHSEEAPADFHARFSAQSKWYRYTLYHGQHARAFLRHTALHTHGGLRQELLHAAAAEILGQHDFRAFMASGSKIQQTTRTIYRSAWSQADAFLYYDIEGSGFLYNMVRILVGTMLDISKGILPPNAVQRALESGSRADAGATAPAKGLMLMGVRYEGFDTQEILGGP